MLQSAVEVDASQSKLQNVFSKEAEDFLCLFSVSTGEIYELMDG